MVDGIQELVEVLQPNVAEPSKTYSAEISKIDNEGTVWVYLEGSDKETPTATTSAEVNVGVGGFHVGICPSPGGNVCVYHSL